MCVYNTSLVGRILLSRRTEINRRGDQPKRATRRLCARARGRVYTYAVKFILYGKRRNRRRASIRVCVRAGASSGSIHTTASVSSAVASRPRRQIYPRATLAAVVARPTQTPPRRRPDIPPMGGASHVIPWCDSTASLGGGVPASVAVAATGRGVFCRAAAGWSGAVVAAVQISVCVCVYV